ncbi:unnamed protein product [Amoebophrya sp. A25]|nr:unnamed protein product [Amoebophrya sp. A25]|eukprot:GSA25T00022666001.1
MPVMLCCVVKFTALGYCIVATIGWSFLFFYWYRHDPQPLRLPFCFHRKTIICALVTDCPPIFPDWL